MPLFLLILGTGSEKDVNVHHREDGNDKNSERGPVHWLRKLLYSVSAREVYETNMQKPLERGL